MDDVTTTRTPAASNWSIALSVLMIVAGFLAFALPLLAGFVVATLVAWLLLMSAGLHLVFAWRGGSAGSVVWEILLGIVYGAIGIYILAHPIAGLASLTLAVALYLFVEGALELILSLRLRPQRGSGWLLFDAIVTLLLAIMIWGTWPSSSEWVLGMLVGISMVFSGVTRLMLSLAARRIAT